MNKLVLFAAALLISGQAGAYAQSADNPDQQHATVKHKRIMSAHAHYRSHEGSIDYHPRESAPLTIGPSYGDDPEANGRTSGSGG